MTEAVATALARIAPYLNGLRPSPDATISYEILSDALWWSDELPEDRGAFFRIKDWSFLRVIGHYRTWLILDQPDEFFVSSVEHDREIWQEARRLFPDWPGFHPRRSASEHKGLYESLSAASRRELEEIEREMSDGGER